MLTLPVIFCTRLSNLSLREFMLMSYPTNLIRLCFLMEHKLAALSYSLKELALHSLFIQLPTPIFIKAMQTIMSLQCI